MSLAWGGPGVSERSRERNNRTPTGAYSTIPASIGRNVGHPPAFLLCLTLNLVAGMRKGRRQRRQRRKRRRWGRGSKEGRGGVRREKRTRRRKSRRERRRRRRHVLLYFVCIFFVASDKQKQEMEPGAAD